MSNVVDGFNRADGAVGNADTGQTWVNLSGVAAIISNQFYFSTKQGGDIAVVETNEADGVVQATLAGGGNDCGLVFRAIDASNFLLGKVLGGGTNQYILYKNTSGNGQEYVTGGAYVPTATHVIVVEFNADAIVGKANGSTIFSTTLSTHQTATKHGLRIHVDDNSTRWDDFSFTGLSVADAGVSAFRQHRESASKANLRRKMVGWRKTELLYVPDRCAA